MSLAYGWEKFYTAVYTAMASDEPLQKRVATAHSYFLAFVAKENVPADVWERLQEWTKAVNSVPPVANERSIGATTSLMTDQEAGKRLEEVAGMFSDIAQAYGVEHQQHVTKKL